MTDPLERCLTTAKQAGVPKDQAKTFLEHGYVPYPWQWSFHAAARECDKPNGPVAVGLGGSRGPGKTHGVFSQITLDDLLRVDGLKFLFLRKTGKAAKESLDDLVVRVLAGRLPYTYTNSTVRYPNGSRVIMGGFKDDKDIDNYIGQEYDGIAVEEGNQLSAEKKEKLRGSLRTSKPNWRPRWYETFNPGGIGHGDVKARYVEPYKSGVESKTRFIPATYRDNPNLNPEYVEYLEGLSGQLGQAWRDGDFDIMAGTYFTEWNERIHVVGPFHIPEEWRRFCMLDYGHEAPSALYWAAVTPDAKVIIYRELYRSGLTFSKLAEEFVSLTPSSEKIEYLVADPSIWSVKGENENELSGAEIFESRVRELTKNAQYKGIRLERGNNDRLAGAAVVREYLRPYQFEEETTAKLQIFDTCIDLIRTLPVLIHDERNPEDVDTNGEDHGYDSLKYGLMSRPKPSNTQEQIADRFFKSKMKEKERRTPKRLLFQRP
jgi:phage terminase large subunit